MPGKSSVSVLVSARIPKELAARLEALAKATRWSKGEIHRQALEFFLPVLESGHALTRWSHERAGVMDLAPQTPPGPPGPDDYDQELIGFMIAVEPGAKRGTLVAFRDLRKACKWIPAAFDARVLNAAKRGILALHSHDHPSSLSDQQRREMVELDGTLYIGASIRQRGK